MKFTLLTYDCTLAHVAGYFTVSDVFAFADWITKIAEQFAAESGLPKESIRWTYGRGVGMVVIYAVVQPDWVPTAETEVWDESYSKSWYAESARNFHCWCAGGTAFVNISQCPPTRAHRLFHTKETA